MKCDNWINPNKVGKQGQLLRSAFLGTRETGAIRAKLGDEARECGGDITGNTFFIVWARNNIEQLADALEQQLTARREAEAALEETAHDAMERSEK